MSKNLFREGLKKSENPAYIVYGWSHSRIFNESCGKKSAIYYVWLIHGNLSFSPWIHFEDEIRGIKIIMNNQRE